MSFSSFSSLLILFFFLSPNVLLLCEGKPPPKGIATKDEWDEMYRKSQTARPGDKVHRAFLGGSESYSEMTGIQFSLLFLAGLKEQHRLLDIGCGSLHLGRSVIPYLLPEKYFCIENSKWMIEDAIHFEIGNDLVNLKRPQFVEEIAFDHPISFDWGTTPEEERSFDFIITQIFSHTYSSLFSDILKQISPFMLDTTPLLFTAVILRENPVDIESTQENRNFGWNFPGVVGYSELELAQILDEANLFFCRLKWPHKRQTWFVASKTLLTAQKLCRYVPYFQSPNLNISASSLQSHHHEFRLPKLKSAQQVTRELDFRQQQQQQIDQITKSPLPTKTKTSSFASYFPSFSFISVAVPILLMILLMIYYA